ncbi:M2 family metallopeptidase [Cohnella soli]|uniref:M2 family metallopeptidase n=1 Tax=Cohnella soli TaxID=425005 RepID=A0ABW0I4E8_9BACL
MNALWMVLTTGESRWVDELEVCETSYQNVITSSQMAETINRLERSSDSKDNRQAVVLSNERLEFSEDMRLREQMTTIWNELHYTIATFRAQIDDASFTEREVHILLRTLTDDEQRKKVWQENMRLGEKIAPGLLQLVRLRNQVAKQKGFSDYFEMKLFAQEVDPDELDRLIEQLRIQLEHSYRFAKTSMTITSSISSTFPPRPGHGTTPTPLCLAASLPNSPWNGICPM